MLVEIPVYKVGDTFLGEIPVYRVGDTSCWVDTCSYSGTHKFLGEIHVYRVEKTSCWVRYLFIEWETHVAG